MKIKWLRDDRTLGIIFGVVVAIFVGVFQSVGWERLLPLLAVVILALIFFSLLTNAEDRISKKIDRTLPAISYLPTKEEVELASINLVEEASKFVIATGGRSRNLKYLQLIEQRVKNEEIIYWRIFYDEILSQEIYDHLCSVISLENSAIGCIMDSAYGNLIITDGGLLIALPVPSGGTFQGIVVLNPEIANDLYIKYVSIIFSKATKITEKEKIPRPK